MRAFACVVVLAAAGCGPASAPTPREPPASAERVPIDVSPAGTQEEAPPAPLGAIVLTGQAPLWVQRCDAEHACPRLLQAEGERHCGELALGQTQGWRLPTREEVARFSGAAGLEQLAGYHWTSTAFEQDGTQVWIVDPTMDQPTTVPRDRKPFVIRCVRAP